MGTRVMTAVLVAALLAGIAGHAQAVGCAYPATFPGENAAPATIAAWMAARAVERGLPGQLPVLAALARSGLSNLPVDRAGRAGYFGMLERLWGDGPYAGFQGDPPAPAGMAPQSAHRDTRSRRVPRRSPLR